MQIPLKLSLLVSFVHIVWSELIIPNDYIRKYCNITIFVKRGALLKYRPHAIERAVMIVSDMLSTIDVNQDGYPDGYGLIIGQITYLEASIWSKLSPIHLTQVLKDYEIPGCATLFFTDQFTPEWKNAFPRGIKSLSSQGIQESQDFWSSEGYEDTKIGSGIFTSKNWAIVHTAPWAKDNFPSRMELGLAGRIAHVMGHLMGATDEDVPCSSDGDGIRRVMDKNFVHITYPRRRFDRETFSVINYAYEFSKCSAHQMTLLTLNAHLLEPAPVASCGDGVLESNEICDTVENNGNNVCCETCKRKPFSPKTLPVCSIIAYCYQNENLLKARNAYSQSSFKSSSLCKTLTLRDHKIKIQKAFS